ncbi:MAG: alpha/beta hydrolase [Acidimicrobiales bacterium]
MEVREVEISGADGPVTLSVAEAGAGGRPIVLVHGFTGAKEDFTEWLDPLADLGWHAIAPDQRGHGASAQPAREEAYTFDLFADDLLALLDAMAVDSTVVLGHSMGGMVVQTAALREPERFDAIVLMDTSHRAVKGVEASLRDLAVAIVRAEGMAALMAAQAALPIEQQPLGTPAHEQLRARRPGYQQFGDRKMLASSPAMYAAMVQTMTDVENGIDRLDDLRAITVPTLVMVGDQDRPFLKPSKRMAEAIDGAELAVIPTAGHSPQFEAPERWWTALSGFLERL